MTFDWKDIRQLRSTRILDVLSTTGKTASGTVTITPDQVMVHSDEPRVFPAISFKAYRRAGPRNGTTGRAKPRSG